MAVIPLLKAVSARSKRCEAPGIRSDPWSFTELVGRLVELSGQGATAALTLVFGLVVQAQRQGEPVAWVSATEAMFYPPDAAAGGVDLQAMVIVRTNSPEQKWPVANRGDGAATRAGDAAQRAGRAADKLLRSGAFGLVVLDLGRACDLQIGLQARLVKLAQKHAAAVVCLTEKPRQAPSLSSLVSLRCVAARARTNKKIAKGEKSERAPAFVCEVQVLKDKRRGPTWQHAEVCCGPPGLR